MARYLLRRLLAIVPIMFVVSLFVFATLHLAGGNAALVLAGQDATPEDIARVTERYGLDEPLYHQYGLWLWQAVQGDLGQSLITKRPVIEEIGSRLLPTVELAAAALGTAVVLGMTMGILSASKPNSIVDNITMVLAFIGVAMPIFWSGLLLIFFFGVRLGWLPTGGVGGIHYLILPAVALSAPSIAVIARMTRSSTLEVIHHDFVRTARAKGLADGRVLRHHILKNALIPVITVIGLECGNLLGGTVLTETVFSRPGLGRLLVDSIRSRDFPVVQGVLLFLTVIFVVVNLVVDILYHYIDPRIRGV